MFNYIENIVLYCIVYNVENYNTSCKISIVLKCRFIYLCINLIYKNI